MGKELFNNIGGDIKTIAKVIANWILGLFILLGIIFIICGCVLLSAGFGVGWVGFLIAIGLFAYGYAYSRFKVMELYAYGEITDRLISIDTKMPNNFKPNKPDKINVKAEKKSENEAPHRTSPWECPFCGQQNPIDVKFCKSCGTEDIGV